MRHYGKLCVEDRSVSFARKFVLGFCDNLFVFFYFPLSWGFLIGNALLEFYYFQFLESFHFSSCKLYNSLQHIFQKTLNFLSRRLIDLFSCQIINQLKTNFENG